jgi:hypothetical protein
MDSWAEQGAEQEARVFASILYRNDVAPEQVLLDHGCKGFRDTNAGHALAQAAYKYMPNSDGSDLGSDADCD